MKHHLLGPPPPGFEDEVQGQLAAQRLALAQNIDLACARAVTPRRSEPSQARGGRTSQGLHSLSRRDKCFRRCSTRSSVVVFSNGLDSGGSVRSSLLRRTGHTCSHPPPSHATLPTSCAGSTATQATCRGGTRTLQVAPTSPTWSWRRSSPRTSRGGVISCYGARPRTRLPAAAASQHHPPALVRCLLAMPLLQCATQTHRHTHTDTDTHTHTHTHTRARAQPHRHKATQPHMHENTSWRKRIAHDKQGPSRCVHAPAALSDAAKLGNTVSHTRCRRWSGLGMQAV